MDVTLTIEVNIKSLTKTITTMAAVLFSASAMAVLPFELTDAQKGDLLKEVKAVARENDILPTTDWQDLGKFQYKIRSYVTDKKFMVEKKDRLALTRMVARGEKVMCGIYNSEDNDSIPIGYVKVREKNSNCTIY